MKLSGFKRSSGHNRRLWPLLLLLVAVIVPTVSMLWFMLAAIDNERIAVQQRLIGAYRAQLIGVKAQLAAQLQQSAVELDRRFADASCTTVFAIVVRAGEADSVICVDAEAPYPYAPGVAEIQTSTDVQGWDEAARLERRGQFEPAARAFARIADRSTEVHVAARALQAQARCLSKDSRPAEAIRVLVAELAQARYRSAMDSRGRLIAPSAQLLALQLIEEPESESFSTGVTVLHERLADYGEPVLPSSQRRFLMSELRRIAPDTPPFDTRAAEDLAADFLESAEDVGTTSGLAPAGPMGLWQLVSPSARIIALHTDASLRDHLMDTVARTDLSAGATADLLPPGADAGTARILVPFAVDEPLPGWTLALHLDEQALVDAATGRQITVYLWTGVLVILLIVAVTSLIAGVIQRQMRVTQLKNDLLATVSHELRTPLASMRLLVETLLDGRDDDPQRVREYLELIDKENGRLSRLVDNFLSYSRMERKKHKFEREEITAAEVARSAAAALGERSHAPGCHLDVEIASDLPRICADPDAMVTALLNLLDNAYKYSGEQKHIVLHAYAEDDEVCFAVQDNGIGLSARARSKIFESFYQVDQSLSRQGSGCGLGLSIVRLIVEAHDGSVDVDSQPGKGSKFTIRIPAAGERDEADAREEVVVG